MIKRFLILSLPIILSSCVSKATYENVQDIYYNPGGYLTPEYFAKTQRIPYTLNLCKTSCIATMIERKFYDDYTKEYTDYGLPYPYPKREGSEGVIQPRS